jgi:multiple sugar transport system ATP-binding protein
VRPASIYLLDEVLSHLDATERTMLRGEIRRIQQLMDLTTLFVTHDQLEALAMSDRIIVMDEGELQQIGTPEEIYDTPENLFVAGFVGEPPMNIMPVERVRDAGSDTLRVAGQELPVDSLDLRWIPDAEEFYLGIRPKYLSLAADGRPGTLKGQVHTFEHLGDHSLSSITLANEQLVFLMSDAEMELELDQNVSISLAPEHVLFYDKHSENRLHEENGLRVRK